MQLVSLASIPLFILNIPVRHVINLIFILGLVIWSYQRVGLVVLNVIPILITYALGTFSRAFDLIVCPLNGFGTHFFWHICVALTAYFTANLFVQWRKQIEGIEL